MVEAINRGIKTLRCPGVRSLHAVSDTGNHSLHQKPQPGRCKCISGCSYPPQEWECVCSAAAWTPSRTLKEARANPWTGMTQRRAHALILQCKTESPWPGWTEQGEETPHYLFVPCPLAQKTQGLGVSVVCFSLLRRTRTKRCREATEDADGTSPAGQDTWCQLGGGITDKFILHSRGKGGWEQDHSL